MIDDEEKQLRRELLAIKLSLRRKQEFWETPRNIAILVGVTAAIAAALGFWLGRGSVAPPAPVARPVYGDGIVDGIMGAQFIDAVETAGIVVIAAMLVYVVVRLDRTLTGAAEKIQEALSTQRELQQTIERVWRRVDLIERSTPGAEVEAALVELKRRLDKMEGGK